MGMTENVSRTLWARGGKRFADVLFASVAVVALAPLVVLAILLIRLASPGPPFFSQVRTGRHGRPFRPLKLRTMTAHRHPDPDEIITPDHPDVTLIARVIRALRIDELPQLLNVLRGEMSLVGPRPTLPQQTDVYDAFQRQRLLVRPGITGLAQVNGSTLISWPERIKYDVYYVRRHGLLMDVGILLRTGLIILLGSGRVARPFEQSPYASKDAAICQAQSPDPVNIARSDPRPRVER